MSKLVKGFSIVVVAFALFAGVAASTADALTQAQVDAIVAAGVSDEVAAILQALVTDASATTSSCALKNSSDLTIGSTGANVEALQQFLVDGGYLVMPAGVSMGYFGSLTQSALASYQAAMGVSPAAGYFGPLTRASISCSTTTTPSTGGTTGGSTPSLSGDAGSIDSYDELGGISNEEVGEDEEGVEIAGIEIEAGEGSDITLVAVRLDFDQGTATNDDLDEFISEVAILVNGEEVARVDADEFDEDNNWAKTITLDSGTVIDADDSSELTVEVDGVSNVDSGDEGDTWTVDFTQVRYSDGTGAVLTDDASTIGTDAFTWSVEDFATATDIELQVSLSSDNPDEGYVHVEEDDDLVLLVFEIEADGSDINIDDISTTVSTTSAKLSDLADRIDLWYNGDIVESENISSSATSSPFFTFSDLDIDIEDGDTEEFSISIRIATSTIASAQGIGVSASVEEDSIDADDETGETIEDADATGSANGETQYPLTDGLVVELVDSSADDPDTTDSAGGEQGDYSLEIRLTAIDDDVYVPVGHTTSTSSIDTDDGFAFVILNGDGEQIALNAVGLASTSAQVVDEDNTATGGYYLIDGDGATFTLNVTLTPSADGYHSAALYGVNYKIGGPGAADVQQKALPITDFDTSAVNLDA